MVDDGSQELVYEFSIAEFDFVEICSDCPQDYNIYRNGELVGYAQTCYGYFFTVCTKDEIRVYENGDIDGYDALSMDERDAELTKAVNCLREHLEDLLEVAYLKALKECGRLPIDD